MFLDSGRNWSEPMHKPKPKCANHIFHHVADVIKIMAFFNSLLHGPQCWTNVFSCRVDTYDARTRVQKTVQLESLKSFFPHRVRTAVGVRMDVWMVPDKAFLTWFLNARPVCRSVHVGMSVWVSEWFIELVSVCWGLGLNLLPVQHLAKG